MRTIRKLLQAESVLLQTDVPVLRLIARGGRVGAACAESPDPAPCLQDPSFGASEASCSERYQFPPDKVI